LLARREQRMLPFLLSTETAVGSRLAVSRSQAMIRPFRGISPQIHPTAFIEESAQIIGDVHIGAHSSVWFGAVVVVVKDGKVLLEKG
jgi:serine acetyltransferase